MTIDADIILPVTTATEHTYLMAVVAIRTCRATTEGRMVVFINNSPPSVRRERLIEQCKLLNIRIVEWMEPFNIAKIFNAGQDMTNGRYIVYATSDVIFYPKWLGNIVRAWERDSSWWCLCNFSFDDQNMPCVKHQTTLEQKVIGTHNPSSGLIVFKRDSNYRWDENFTLWEIDADLHYHIVRNNLKAGCCLDSRCDHLINAVKTDVQGWQGEIDPSSYLRKKWNLPLPKEQQ